MQIGLEVLRGRVKNPGSIKPEHMILKFKQAGPAKTLSVEEASAIAKARSLARVGMAPQVVTVPRPDSPTSLSDPPALE
jgi:hypothetical protein